jgi:hypothetical protein
MQMSEEERENYFSERKEESGQYAKTTSRHFRIIFIILVVSAFVYYNLGLKQASLIYFGSLIGGLPYIILRILVGTMGEDVRTVSSRARDQLHMMYIGLFLVFIFGGITTLDKMIKIILGVD